MHVPEPADEPAVYHWGHVNVGLLDDPIRYPHYARSHHVAGHCWGLRWQSVPPMHAGLSLSLPLLPEETAGEIEAIAVLVEALAAECVTELQNVLDFGAEEGDVNWDSVGRHIERCRGQARARGCRRHAPFRWLEDVAWVHHVGMTALDDWTQITRLTDHLGLGHVLEADQVSAVLNQW